jgi:hypothetical protein
MESTGLERLYVGPEADEILGGGGTDEQTIDHRVAQEQHEVFVVAVAHAVVHPWAMVILF